jgi:hypothetical protein
VSFNNQGQHRNSLASSFVRLGNSLRIGSIRSDVVIIVAIFLARASFVRAESWSKMGPSLPARIVVGGGPSLTLAPTRASFNLEVTYGFRKSVNFASVGALTGQVQRGYIEFGTFRLVSIAAGVGISRDEKNRLQHRPDGHMFLGFPWPVIQNKNSPYYNSFGPIYVSPYYRPTIGYKESVYVSHEIGVLVRWWFPLETSEKHLENM